MIINIPTSVDFEEEGINSLNLAWDLILPLVIEYNEIINDYESDNSIDIAYWKSAKKNIITSISLAQHGSEFLLKGKIAQISPFLLINIDPSSLPKDSGNKDLSFGDFKTIDAQYLIRIHDIVSSVKITDKFKQEFNSMRVKRNSIMHTVTKDLLITVNEVLVSILEISNELIAPLNWMKIRREHLVNSPTYILSDLIPYIDEPSEGYLVQQLSDEISNVTSILGSSLVERYFGFKKNVRKYICPKCMDEKSTMSFFELDLCDEHNFLAFLKPNKPNSTGIYCSLCNEEYEIARVKCVNPDCKGNVIDITSNHCLSCWEEQ